jgi:hypothetical protein
MCARLSNLSQLRLVRAAHTLIWAFFAACIVAVPVLAHGGQLRAAVVLIGVVTCEIAVLLVNHWRCPLTSVAARYTDDRSPNFDIFLPVWLAKHNKTIFGALFVAGGVYTLVEWLTARSF